MTVSHIYERTAEEYIEAYSRFPKRLEAHLRGLSRKSTADLLVMFGEEPDGFGALDSFTRLVVHAVVADLLLEGFVTLAEEADELEGTLIEDIVEEHPQLPFGEESDDE